MKIISIVGARPQFIKLWPLSAKIRELFVEQIIHTGQHYDSNMSDLFFEDLNLPCADYNLKVGSGSHGQQTAAMLEGISNILSRESPAAVIVFGDTNSNLAGALAAAKLQIPLFHIEAGLRSFNRTMPEETNRVVTDHLSDYLFAPTEAAMINLGRENLADRAHFTGDIMVDALRASLSLIRSRPSPLQPLGLSQGSYILLTLHRSYNVDDPECLRKMLSELSRLDQAIVFPVHPRTKKALGDSTYTLGRNIKLIEPLGYLDFIALQSGAEIIVTDSGGIQKEAYLLGKPCVTLRTETEWVETVAAGWNLLLDPSLPDLAGLIKQFTPSGATPELYGRDVAKKMVKLIAAAIS